MDSAKVKRGLWSKAFLLSILKESRLSARFWSCSLSRKGNPMNAAIWVVCPVHFMLWGYVGVMVRPDLAKYQQHLRQWTNLGLSWSETQQAKSIATPTASLPLCSWSTLYITETLISQKYDNFKGNLKDYLYNQCGKSTLPTGWILPELPRSEFVFSSATLAGDQRLFGNPILSDRMVFVGIYQLLWMGE